jgi:hypothetical protein
MAHIFGTVLVAMLSAPFVAISCSEASAQERNLLASTVTLRQAAGLPKAVRGLLANWLLDCGASEKMRISAAIRNEGPARAQLVGAICASAHSFERPDPPGTLASIVAKASPGVRFNEHEQFLLVLPWQLSSLHQPLRTTTSFRNPLRAMQDC